MGKTENKETNSRLTENEAKISYLIKDIEDLSDIVAKQSLELEKLNKKVSFLNKISNFVILIYFSKILSLKHKIWVYLIKTEFI